MDKSNLESDSVCEATLMGTIISVVAGVIAFYSGQTERDTVALIQTNGLTRWLLIYLSADFFSLKYPTGVEISFSRLKWH